MNYTHVIGFAVIAFGMALTPGPNMIYLMSRSISQGKVAGFISLLGVALGFVFYMVSAVLGLTSLLLAVPFAYDTIRILGALYLLWLAWKAIRQNGASPFQTKTLAPDSPRKLFLMGFFTNLFNPKIAVMYLSLLPQFIDPIQGHVFMQSLLLGVVQIVCSVTVNGCIVFSAGTIAAFLIKKPSWAVFQRWLMGTVFMGLAIKMLTDARK